MLLTKVVIGDLDKEFLMRTHIKLTLLIFVMLSLIGCQAAQHIFIPHKDVAVDTGIQGVVDFPELWSGAHKRVLVQFHNSTLKDASLYENELKSHISTHKHSLVTDPMAANVVMQVTLIHTGEINKGIAEQAFLKGFGKPLLAGQNMASVSNDRTGAIVDVRITYRGSCDRLGGIGDDTWYSQQARFLTMTRKKQLGDAVEEAVIKKSVYAVLELL